MGSRLVTTATAIAVLAAVLAGCAGAEFTYVMGSDGQSYFKVPASWRKVDQKALDREVFGDLSSATAQARKQLSWTVGYDGFREPSADHLLGGKGDEPFVFAMVSTLTETQRDAVSLDTLRNTVLPVAVDDETREKLEDTSGYPYKGFELLKDEVLQPGDGVRGVHVVYNLKVLGGPVQTFDQTTYLAADGTRVSVLLIRCSATCYRARAGELDRIAQSFKVKRVPG
ncbi:hypothetical protein Sme01_09700 [Sphaerisporangium melleum]|uniref:Lipoprotein n=1 Tax=Sphaerisporangium melleum TaxID=321316 RepID=A0A917QT60_9ACTN|nr:hypothetical protein [Sphaerisporangium melleum]GGK67299.1 hypothetical protein GCM10007964_07910 [Sphaerisporangium melleum]GII68494.1 hypothetical protein Sme01_09700 [Sphaerisporangium melleum]